MSVTPTPLLPFPKRMEKLPLLFHFFFYLYPIFDEIVSCSPKNTKKKKKIQQQNNEKERKDRFFFVRLYGFLIYFFFPSCVVQDERIFLFLSLGFFCLDFFCFVFHFCSVFLFCLAFLFVFCFAFFVFYFAF